MGCPAYCVIGENLGFSIASHDPDTGIVTDADGNVPYRVYEENGTTALLTGNMTLMVDAGDSSNTTGFYTALIACTTANGFESGKTYHIYIEATVDGDKGAIPLSFKCWSQNVAAGVLSEITGSSDIPAEPTVAEALMLLYMWLRNNTQDTSSERRILNDAGTEVLDAAMSDDGTTFQQGKLGDA